MTLPPPPATSPGTVEQDGDARARASAAALERRRAHLRRPRLVYAVTVTVVVAALVAFVAVVWSRGEAAHVTLRTVAHPPATLPTAEPAATQTVAWRTNDSLALGTPISGGTVISWSTHTVRGRDARTGRQTWSYTRTDRHVCAAVQISGVTVAVYADGRDCDEVTALDSGTGKRVWTRTLDEDGVTLNGPASYSWTSDTILIWSPNAMYSIDPSSGIDRWTYRRYGCSTSAAVLGSAGTLISQNCTHPRCAGVKFCGRGRQLVLRTAAGQLDTSKPNFDQFAWNDLGNSDVPLSAGTVVAALDRGTGRIDTYTAAKGRLQESVTAEPAPTTTAGARAVDTSTGALVWIGGTATSVIANRATPDWSQPALAVPTVTSASLPPNLATATITAVVSGGVASLDGADGGKVVHRYSLPGLSGLGTRSRAYPLSNGFLVGTSSGTAAYR